MTNPAAVIPVVLIGTRIGASVPTCDPAINLDAPGCAAALSRYERERSPDALAALPLKPDAKPVTFRVSPLTAAAWRVAGERADVAGRLQLLVSLGCHAYTDERGVEHTATSHGALTSPRPGIALAADEWVDHLHDAFGEDAVAELAKVIADRTEAGPRALAPFRLPRGLMLAR